MLSAPEDTDLLSSACFLMQLQRESWFCFESWCQAKLSSPSRPPWWRHWALSVVGHRNSGVSEAACSQLYFMDLRLETLLRTERVAAEEMPYLHLAVSSAVLKIWGINISWRSRHLWAKFRSGYIPNALVSLKSQKAACIFFHLR